MQLSEISLVRVLERRAALQKKKELTVEYEQLSANSSGNFLDPSMTYAIKQSYQRLVELKASLATLLVTKDQTLIKYQNLLQEANLLDKKETVVTDLLTKLTDRYVLSLDEQLNEVYFYVYRKENKRVKLEIKEQRGAMVIQLQVVTKEGNEEFTELYDDEGYSVSVVLGVLFLIYFIVQNSLPRFLIFDETFGGLSPQSLSRFFPFLKSFAESLDFGFLFITHDQLRIQEYMDKLYEIVDGVYIERPVNK